LANFNTKGSRSFGRSSRTIGENFYLASAAMLQKRSTYSLYCRLLKYAIHGYKIPALEDPRI
jgi:hypothetical protein